MPAEPALPRRCAARFHRARLQRAALGAWLGLTAGGAGVLLLGLLRDAPSALLLGMVMAVPALTGLICGARGIRRPPLPGRPGTAFSESLVHIGSRLSPNSFLLRYGLSRGFIQPVAASAPPRPRPAAAAAESGTDTPDRNIKNQSDTVTTITYDSQTNHPHSDTIARDQLASARLALLSMDHTKQIPH